MTITPDAIRAKIEARLKWLDGEIVRLSALDAERGLLAKVIETGVIPLDALAGFMALGDAPVAEPAAKVRKASVRQNERGSKAWNEGRAAHGAGASPVSPIYKEGSVADLGFRAGWDESKSEMVPMDDDNASTGQRNDPAPEGDEIDGALAGTGEVIESRAVRR